MFKYTMSNPHHLHKFHGGGGVHEAGTSMTPSVVADVSNPWPLCPASMNIMGRVFHGKRNICDSLGSIRYAAEETDK